MDDDEKWSQRRLRHLNNYGIKKDKIVDKLRSDRGSGTVYQIIDGESRNAAVFDGYQQNGSNVQNGIIERRQSVFQMALDGLGSILNGDIFRRRTIKNSNRRREGHASRMPTYVSVRERSHNLIGNSSFPAHRNCRKNSHREMTTCRITTPGTVTTIYNNGRQCVTANEIPQAETDEDLDEATMQEILFFGESLEKCPQSQQPKELHRNSIEATSFQRLENIRMPKKKKASRLESVLNFFGYNGEESDKRFRSLIKFNFSTRQNGDVKTRSMPIYGKFRSDAQLTRQLKDQSCDYRPYFTYWISTVHILVTLFMLMNYGIGTDFSNGLGVIERNGDVMTSSLSLAHIVVWEVNNIWIGPRFADLVHAGAKFTPCMRMDSNIHDQILAERHVEAELTGCCITRASSRSPAGWCFQTSECSKQFAQLITWVNGTFPEAGYSRVVCGQDPRYCASPRSVHPFLWGHNISTWPVCEKKHSDIPRTVAHMHCEVTGHPCCIQMHGQCRITSREYCDFVRGYYYPNATLCSQVSCLNAVCGMTPFLKRDHPDQLYRLITPLFIHAGIIRCAISLSLYMTIMRRFEIMIGWTRLSAIYFVSGIGGYLASAVFVPYMPEVGPAGSEGGVLAALIVNIIYNWDLLRRPARTLLFHLGITAVLFCLGFLPYIDNWAQFFGFIFGCLMAIALIPYFKFGNGNDKNRRRIIVTGSLAIAAVLFIQLLFLFSFHPVNYEFLGLFNCPFSSQVCDHHGLTLRNWLPI